MSPDEAARRRAAERLRRLLSEARAAFPAARIPEPVLRMDLRGVMAGQAQGSALVRLNADLLARHGERFLEEVLAHETAHCVVHAVWGPRARPHGPEWRWVMERVFGVTARRCHAYDTRHTRVRRLARHLAACDCGEHEITSIRVNRMRRGQVYRCVRCRAPLRLKA